MRRLNPTIVAMGFIVAMIPLDAKANFILRFTRTAISSGPNAGFDFVTFRAFNDGTNGTGTKLLGTAITLSLNGNGNPPGDHFIFRFANLDPDNVPDADVTMSAGVTFRYSDGAGNETRQQSSGAFSTAPNSSSAGTAIRPRGTGENLADWNAQAFLPGPPKSDPTFTLDPVDSALIVDSSVTPTKNPSAFYNNTNVREFRVEGVYLGPGSAPLANTGTPGSATGGALFATAIVPFTSWITLSGQLAGDTGSPQAVFFQEPEPGSVALLGVAAVGLLGWRRRA
jgi:hypothetical protein